MKGVLVVIVRMILWTSKGETERRKLTEAEKQIFVTNFRSGCMHKGRYEDE